MPSLLSIFLMPILPPLLILLSLPLAAFAALTTTLAFFTLLLRVSLIYLDLTSSVVKSYFASGVNDKPSRGTRLRLSSSNLSLAQQRARRGSTASFGSQEFQPQSAKSFYPGFHKNDSFASLLGAGVQGPSRDYEGIGGWRNEDDDPEREAIWLGINKRLELPVVSPPARRHHRRSYTGGSQVSLSGQIRPESQRWSGVWSPETLRMSPVQSRARTPSVTERTVTVEGDEGGYFALQQQPRISGEGVMLKTTTRDGRRKSVGKDDKDSKRRKSASGDSTSSIDTKTSRGTTKHVAYV